MKTFYERFLDEVARKLEAGEIDEKNVAQWMEEVKEHLQHYAETHPNAPIVRMPQNH